MMNIMYFIEKRNARGTAPAVPGEAKNPVGEHDSQSQASLLAAPDDTDFADCERKEIEEYRGVGRVPECNQPENQPSR
jgi:hypothetical protein